MTDNKKQRWLKPNLETEAQKAARRRIAKEQNPSLDDVMQQLDAEIEKQKSAPSPRPSSAPRAAPAPRTEPTLIEERPDPKVSPNAPRRVRLGSQRRNPLGQCQRTTMRPIRASLRSRACGRG